jgi:hypothetical protein
VSTIPSIPIGPLLGFILALIAVGVPWIVYRSAQTMGSRAARNTCLLLAGACTGWLAWMVLLLAVGDSMPDYRAGIRGSLWLLNLGLPVGLILGGLAALKMWNHVPKEEEATP